MHVIRGVITYYNAITRVITALFMPVCRSAAGYFPVVVDRLLRAAASSTSTSIIYTYVYKIKYNIICFFFLLFHHVCVPHSSRNDSDLLSDVIKLHVQFTPPRNGPSVEIIFIVMYLVTSADASTLTDRTIYNRLA